MNSNTLSFVLSILSNDNSDVESQQVNALIETLGFESFEQFVGFCNLRGRGIIPKELVPGDLDYCQK